jgi:hypothetical protein
MGSVKMSRVRALASGLVSASILAFGEGCGGGHDAAEKELGELRAEISRLRANQAALTERLDAVESSAGAANASGAAGAAKGAPSALRPPGPPVPAPVAARDGDRPDLDVVKLAPPPSEGDGDVDNDPSRPLVKVVGEQSSRQTLNNRSIGAHPSKKSVSVVPPKKDGDARPAVKQ